MIYIGLGANLTSPEHGAPEATLTAALDRFPGAGVSVLACSPWYRSAPVPRSDQPWFLNGVVAVETSLEPGALLAALHGIESDLGRIRRERWGPRVVDLDLLAFHDVVLSAPEGPQIPHPRMHERAFVLLPLADITPDWRHPVRGVAVQDMINGLDPDQEIERIGALQEASAGNPGARLN